jgi:hypothetical protein
VIERLSLLALFGAVLLVSACAADTVAKSGVDGEVCFIDEDCREPLICDGGICGSDRGQAGLNPGTDPSPDVTPDTFGSCPGQEDVPEGVLVLTTLNGSFNVGETHQVCITMSKEETARLGEDFEIRLEEATCRSAPSQQSLGLFLGQPNVDDCASTRIQASERLGVYEARFVCNVNGEGFMLIQDGDLGEYFFRCNAR